MARTGAWLLRVVVFSFVAITLIFACSLAWLLWVAMDPPMVAERKGDLVNALETASWPVPGGQVSLVSLTSSSGLATEIALRIPAQPLPGRPLVVMLGGQETGRQAVELLPDTRGVAVAALSYPFGVIPHRNGLRLALALPTIQRGIFDTPAAALLAIDYLMASDDLRPERLEMAGISFGAYLASVPAALDSRVQRLWLIHGSGDPQDVIAAGLEGRVPGQFLRRGIGWLLASIAGAGHLAPELWVDRIPPRPIIAVNAIDDSALTEQAVATLHASLQEPFEVLWSPGDHVHPKRPETIEFITDLLFQRISADALSFQSSVLNP